ncbi:anti-sigma factor antagonist [Desulfonema ishimotonii]|uniref:Anti-sigma factor antagonist n=1 Tax=Desulfonema ishimotonii TaxID=45657 RepID=A0A401G1E5_9BACT|nr:STAS domain-containing protein [Desulfonema ishimotonii]GBC63034.1 anti-sigma factor antagonist [Desulfonema ishimotonii]
MELQIKREAERVVFYIRGDVDETGAEILEDRFRELDLSGVGEAVFDFKEVPHIGSAGIGRLLLFYKDMAINGGEIVVQNVPEPISELFEMVKLDSIFKILKA